MYKIAYDLFSGNVIGVVDEQGTTIPIDIQNRDFRVFLEWNLSQATPLDYTTPASVTPPVDAIGIDQRLVALEDAVLAILIGS